MTAVLITWNDKSVQQYLKDLPGRVVATATVRALNKVAANVRTSASTEIRKERNLSAKVVRDAMAIRKASKGNLVSSLVVTGRPIPLKDYKANQTKKGVTVSVTPGTRKLIQHHGNRAFIVPQLGSHVFAREGADRLPIKKLYGPGIPSTFLKDRVKAAWIGTAKEAIQKRMIEELRFELARSSK